MELDLQRFWNVNRRILMWIVFFAILYLMRDFFALVFLTFIFGFLMRRIAKFLTANTRSPYWLSVLGPYLVMLVFLIMLITQAIPRVVDEGAEFSKSIPTLLRQFAGEVEKTARRYDLERALAKYVNRDLDTRAAPGMATGTMPERAPTTAPVEDPFSEINIDDLTERIQTALLSLMPHSEETAGRTFPTVFVDFVRAVVGGTLEFFLAFLLSFMIVLDYDRIGRQLAIWGRGPVGRFFHEASASVVDFSAEVGNAFQCQILVALLNAAITCLGMFLLGIKPLLLLTVIVFLFGLIPVLGVFISSVPIVLIAFNTYGLTRALMTIGMIIIVHALEAYLFNPRIYAARFHLNPVIVLIILLVGHELFGVWGMLLGIPVTHYVLHAAQASRGRKPTEPQSLEEAGMPELHTE